MLHVLSNNTSIFKEEAHQFFFFLINLSVIQEYESLVRSRLPDKNFATMVSVLQKFFNFMNLTASVIIRCRTSCIPRFI